MGFYLGVDLSYSVDRNSLITYLVLDAVLGIGNIQVKKTVPVLRKLVSAGETGNNEKT